jgi:hypothetical protein
MSGGTPAWQDSDPVEEDLKAGVLGYHGPFDGWPEEAYANHPMYQMWKRDLLLGSWVDSIQRRDNLWLTHEQKRRNVGI